MTIERHASRQQLVCDACGDAQRSTYGAGDFDIMLEDARRDGWITTRQHGDWIHTCPDCAGSQKQQRRLL
jgi:hypothetical protein